MDTEELIRKCKGITLKEEEAEKISFTGNMKKKGKKLAGAASLGRFCFREKWTQKSVQKSK